MKAIAIIGLGCRFPKAKNPEAFWKLMVDQVHGVTEVPSERGKLSKALEQYSLNHERKVWGGFLDDIENFDSDFFQISSREAIHLDPQQRLLLQIAWETFEDAGIIPSKLKASNTGVFIGSSSHEYAIRSFQNTSLVTPYTGTGNASSILANRLSYQFDFQGPSIVVDTACSSSLVAVHLACEYLQNSGTGLAIAGGVNLILSPMGNEVFDQANVLSKLGRCKTFDAGADGFIRSEGAGIVLLKPLDQAIADGDFIYSIIRGSAVNQDGRTNGLMAPNRWSQENVIKQALQDAEVEPKDVQYIEAHGTGTLLGDPIEASALGSIYSQGRDDDHPLLLGSVKTNIGHTESAAGIAGLIKIALSMRHNQIPATLHYEKPNPYIPFEKLKLRVQTDLTPWPSSKREKCYAGISSFGFGGTNAHVVLEQYSIENSTKKTKKDVDETPSFTLFPLSSRSLPALQNYAQKYLNYLGTKDDFSLLDLESLAFTAANHRTHFESRAAFVVNNLDELKVNLKSLTETNGSINPKAVFVFSGQGSQWQGMAKKLLNEEPIFRQKIMECDQAIYAESGWSILKFLAEAQTDFGDDIEKIQPLLFAIAVSLAELWKFWGIIPEVTIGHSMGEVAAAHVAKILSLPDAVKIICRRSLLMAKLKGKGAMAVLEINRATAEAIVNQVGARISIAAVNGPNSIVLSGERESLAKIVDEFKAKGNFSKFVNVDMASHSNQVDSILDEVRNQLAEVKPASGECRFYSTVKNKFLDGTSLNADYWVDNLRNPVYFYESISSLMNQGSQYFVELSPHPLLLTAIEETGRELEKTAVMALPSLRRDDDSRGRMLRTLGALYTLGFNPCWKNLYSTHVKREKIPTYSWLEKKYWLEETLEQSISLATSKGLQGIEVLSADHRTRKLWNLNINSKAHGYLEGHRMQGSSVFPGVGYVEIAIQAGKKIFNNKSFVIQHIKFHRALFLNEEEEIKVQAVACPITQAGSKFEIYSEIQNLRKTTFDPPHWALHASGSLVPTRGHQSNLKFNIVEIKRRLARRIDGQTFYDRLAKVGQEYAGAFQGVKTIDCGLNEGLIELDFSKFGLKDLESYAFHPAVLDSSLQGILALKQSSSNDVDTPYWLKSIEEIQIQKNHLGLIPKWCYAKLDFESESATAILIDSNLTIIADLKGIEVERVQSSKFKLTQPKRKEDWMYEVQWQSAPPKVEVTLNVPSDSLEYEVLFCDQSGVGNCLTKEWHNKNYFVVSSGKKFKKLKAERYWEINPKNLMDYHKIFEKIRTTVPKNTKIRVIYLWALDLKGEYGENHRRTPYFSILYLLKEVERLESTFAIKICVATLGAQYIEHNQKSLNIFQTPVWGLCRSLMEEHPNVFEKLVDLDPQLRIPGLASSLKNELKIPNIENQVAYRNEKRLCPRLIRIPASTKPILPMQLFPDRTYLLTGGLGKLGVVAAKWLIEKGARRLLILGRSKILDRSKWKNLDPKHAAFKNIATLIELEKLGCFIDYRSIDVGNYLSLKRVIEEYRLKALPPMAGVIHAAGVVFAKPFTEMDSGEIENILTAKVDGAWNLHRIFEKSLEKIDFFVGYSSFSSLLNSPYLAVYAAGNSFLDGLIHLRRNLGLPGLSVNWGTWAENSTQSLNAQGTYLGIGVLPPASSMKILEDLVGEGRRQAAVAIIDWTELKRSYPRLGDSRFLKVIMNEVGVEQENSRMLTHPSLTPDGTSIQASLTALKFTERKDFLENYIASIVARAIHRTKEEISLSQPLNTLGLDSLIALEMKNSITRDIGIIVPVVLFLNGTTPLQLADYLAKHFKMGSEGDLKAKATHSNQFDIPRDQLTHEELERVLVHFRRTEPIAKKRRVA